MLHSHSHAIPSFSLGYEHRTYLGKLATDHIHGVSGEVYSIGNSKLMIEKFTFDGQTPKTYFIVGTKG